MAVIKISGQELEEKIKTTNNKIVVDCYADWCGPCRMIAPIIEDISNEINMCDFYKLNVDDNELFAHKYNIMSIPTILIFENNNLKDRIIGFHSKEEIIAKIK